MKKGLTAKQIYNQKAEELGLPQTRTPTRVKRLMEIAEGYRKKMSPK